MGACRGVQLPEIDINMVNILKFQLFLFLFLKEGLVIRTGVHKIGVRIAYWEALIRLLLQKQTASSEAD